VAGVVDQDGCMHSDNPVAFTTWSLVYMPSGGRWPRICACTFA
jgi:hypothetical protein